MATAAFPSVITAIFDVASADLLTRVTRGRDTSNTSGDVVMVGVQDVESTGWESAGSFRQTMQSFGGNREEVGTVNGLVFANNGGGNQAAALETAFGYLATLEAAVRADKTLGLTAFDYVVAEMRSGDVTESQNESGATAVVTFAIDYKIRI